MLESILEGEILLYLVEIVEEVILLNELVSFNILSLHSAFFLFIVSYSIGDIGMISAKN